jgi:hypothetical protein
MLQQQRLALQAQQQVQYHLQHLLHLRLTLLQVQQHLQLTQQHLMYLLRTGQLRLTVLWLVENTLLSTTHKQQQLLLLLQQRVQVQQPPAQLALHRLRLKQQ